MILDLPITPTIDILNWALDLAQAPVVRPISKWVEEEIVLPNGPHANERYRHRNHPASRLWFECLEWKRWSRFAASGPTQNGKTLMCYVLPVLYQIFEMKETVVIGLPDMGMANDKWSQDFLPIIEASRYADLLPLKGEGSRDGKVKQGITFRHGPTMRFMTAGGGDKSRAGYTSRIIAITETDGMDEAGEASREADKIKQIEARSRAYGDDKRVYLECTVSIERGRIWQEIKNGTDSKIIRPCPHCGAWVSPEREHLIGWQAAASEGEARDLATWSCPNCAKPWTEAERRKAAESVKLVHRGQEVAADGTITGEPVRTDTLGFRWSAIDNPFATASQVGAEEWKATRSKDRDNAEKEMRQFVWCLPYEPPEIEITPLDAEDVLSHIATHKRGIIPPESLGVVVQVDTGKRFLHWTALAVKPTDGGHVIEYGMQHVDSEHKVTREALTNAFCSLREYFAAGWSGVAPRQIWIDSGYYEHTDAVYDFCELANKGLPQGQERWRPTKGYGEGQQKIGRYVAPEKRGDGRIFMGDNYHIDRAKRNKKILAGVMLVHVNADYWKSKLHERLAMPATEPAAVTIYHAADPSQHADFAQHLVAERQIEKFFPLRGSVITWERRDRQNHWFDATYGALCAADFLRATEVKSLEKKPRLSLAEMAKAARG